MAVASPILAVVKDCGPPTPCLQFGIARSSWFRCRHSECAGWDRRILGTAGHSGRAQPCLYGTPSLFRESCLLLHSATDLSSDEVLSASRQTAVPIRPE